MQFKPELIEKILTGDKFQTRRLRKLEDSEEFAWEWGADNDTLVETSEVVAVIRSRRQMWLVGQTYAVQPGRGKPSIARIKILRIRREDVRDISHEDAIAEGFDSQRNFWHTWCSFYDPQMARIFNAIDPDDGIGFPTVRRLLRQMGAINPFQFAERPDHLYDAWALDFELVQSSNNLLLSVYGEGVGGRGR